MGVVSLIGAFCFFLGIGTSMSESISVVWIVVTAVCTYVVGYCYYSNYIASKLELDDNRATPAIVNNDGRDFWYDDNYHRDFSIYVGEYAFKNALGFFTFLSNDFCVGIYMRFLRPGMVVETSIIGFALFYRIILYGCT